MTGALLHKLEQIVKEKQIQKDVMIKEIQDLQEKLSQLENEHYELYGELESLEHVLELLKPKKHNKGEIKNGKHYY